MAVDVAMLRWPAEEPRREHLRTTGRPRLLLLDDGFGPPAVLDCLEDWIRVPAAEDDVRARIDALTTRARSHHSLVPDLDGHGVLRFDGSWISLPPVEARLTAALLDRFEAVVSREAMARAGWPDGAPGRNALDVHVLRLRRRLSALGLVIRTVRSRGYLLETSPSISAEATARQA